MMITEKQQVIINFLKENGTINCDQTTCLFESYHMLYYSRKKNARIVLIQLLKKGVIERVERGIYKLTTRQKRKIKAIEQSGDQLNLF